jgi:hypothetical protein
MIFAHNPMSLDEALDASNRSPAVGVPVPTQPPSIHRIHHHAECIQQPTIRKTHPDDFRLEKPSHEREIRHAIQPATSLWHAQDGLGFIKEYFLIIFSLVCILSFRASTSETPDASLGFARGIHGAGCFLGHCCFDGLINQGSSIVTPRRRVATPVTPPHTHSTGFDANRNHVHRRRDPYRDDQDDDDDATRAIGRDACDAADG